MSWEVYGNVLYSCYLCGLSNSMFIPQKYFPCNSLTVEVTIQKFRVPTKFRNGHVRSTAYIPHSPPIKKQFEENRRLSFLASGVFSYFMKNVVFSMSIPRLWFQSF